MPSTAYPLVDANMPARRTATKIKAYLDNKMQGDAPKSVEILYDADGVVQIQFGAGHNIANATLGLLMQELGADIEAKASIRQEDNGAVDVLFTGEGNLLRKIEITLDGKRLSAGEGRSV